MQHHKTKHQKERKTVGPHTEARKGSTQELFSGKCEGYLFTDIAPLKREYKNVIISYVTRN